MALTPFSDNIETNAPKVLDNKNGRFSGGKWRPYNDVAEYLAAYPILASRAWTQQICVLNPTDATKADIYMLDSAKVPYKVVGGVEVAELISKVEALETKAITIINSVVELEDYEGESNMVFLNDSVRGGFFEFTDDENLIVDGGMVFYSEKGSNGRWIRYAEQSTPQARYYDYTNEVESLQTYIDGTIIRISDMAYMRAMLLSGKGLKLTIMGSSIAAGASSYPPSFAGVYGEATSFVNASGQMFMAMAIMTKVDPNFVALDPNIFPVVEPFNANNQIVSSGNQDRIFLPYHFMTAGSGEYFTYPIRQKGSYVHNKLTVYYCVRTSSASAKFDIVTSLGTTSVDTYIAPLTYVTPNTAITYQVKKVTVDIEAVRNLDVTINNINNTGVGHALILGFTTGYGVAINNIAVSSASLKDSQYNIDRGITTDERFNLAISFNTDFYIIQFVDSRFELNTNPFEFAGLLKDRIKQIRAVNPQCVILLVTNPEALPGEPSGRELIPHYNRAMRQVAIEENCSFYDVQKLFNSISKDGLYQDYIHPTPLGHLTIGHGLCAAYGIEPIRVAESPVSETPVESFRDFGLGALSPAVFIPAFDTVDPTKRTLNTINVGSGMYAFAGGTVGAPFTGSGTVSIVRSNAAFRFSQFIQNANESTEPKAYIRNIYGGTATPTVTRELAVLDLPPLMFNDATVPDFAVSGTKIFTRTSATSWVLPAASTTGLLGKTHFIKNRASFTLTLTSADNSIYDKVAGQASIALRRGESCTLVNDGTYWVLFGRPTDVGGTSTINGSGQTTVNIAHGLGVAPPATGRVSVIAKSADAITAQIASWTEDSTNIIVTLKNSAAVGTGNLSFVWEVKL